MVLCILNIFDCRRDSKNWLQWYILEMRPKGLLKSGSHGQAFENLTVIDGQIEVECGETKEKLLKGDTFRFQSNREHTKKYLKTKNPSVDDKLY